MEVRARASKCGVLAAAIGVVLLVPVAASPLAAQQVSADTSGTHVVREGDTLWDLAGQYLRNPFLWPEIFEINRALVADPDLIFPRERLLIPGLRGPASLLGVPARDAAPFAMGVMQAPAEARTVFFAVPASQRGRTFVGVEDVPSPTVAPDEFYSAGLLVPEELIRPLGRLEEVQSPTVIPIDIPAQAQPYELVYISLAAPGAVTVGETLHLIREGRWVAPYGRIFESTGQGVVTAIDGATATVEIREHYDLVEVGNIAVALPDYSVPIGPRPAPAGGVEGRILVFEDPQPVPGVEDVAYVDMGAASGLTEGDELVAVLPAEQKSWGLRPEIEVARLQVVRVAERTSAVRVISMRQPALAPGLAVRLVARMPAS
jgi:hypothetical protein